MDLNNYYTLFHTVAKKNINFNTMNTKTLPFRIDGVYAKKEDEEFSNEKQSTKLGSMWKIAQGKREYDNYHILCFKKEYSSNKDSLPKFNADFSTMHGELFMIVDDAKTSFRPSFDKVEIHVNSFKLENNDLIISGGFDDVVGRVTIKVKSTGETDTLKMRFIPFI